MKIIEQLKIALNSLWSNKFRTFLTTLGIIIGVMSVVGLLGVGKGTQAYIQSSFDSIGSNTIYATIGGGGNFSGPPGMAGGFSVDQVDRVIDSPRRYIKYVATQVTGNQPVVSDFEEKRLSIVGQYGEYGEVFNISINKGRGFNDSDSSRANKVVVIGSQLVTDMFNDGDPIGQTLKIGKTKFTVIGIAEETGVGGFDNPDEYIYMPFRTYSKYIIKSDSFPLIAMTATSNEQTGDATEEASQILRRVRKLDKDQEDDFRVRDAGELLDTIKQFTGILTWFLAAVAAISLLVGGIGVMNIMFVSITERTKEIGLRKSLGATNSDITTQFLTESILVSMIGGIMGIVLGILLSYGLSSALDIPKGVYWDSVLLGVLFSVFIGIVFGIYPALKASKLNPIDALRYE